jgi:Iron-containing redox enzyme
MENVRMNVEIEAAALEDKVDCLLEMDGVSIDASASAGPWLTELPARFAAVCDRAYGLHDATSERVVQSVLNKLYQLCVTVPAPGVKTAESSALLCAIRNVLEDAFLASQDAAVPAELLMDAPTAPGAYRAWLYEIIHAHPANLHPLYHDYLARHATAEDLRFLMVQESAIDASTDDFLALMQVGLRGRPKLEIAANYWDEMGNGSPDKVHSMLFGRALDSFEIGLSESQLALETQSLVCGNLQLMLGLRREHVYKAIGYFAVSEYMTPQRFIILMDAWQKNGLDMAAADYHLLHIDLDQDHANRWFNEVVGPMIESNPAVIPEITWGAVCRLNTSFRYLDSIFEKLPSRSRNERPPASRHG